MKEGGLYIALKSNASEMHKPWSMLPKQVFLVRLHAHQKNFFGRKEVI